MTATAIAVERLLLMMLQVMLVLLMLLLLWMLLMMLLLMLCTGMFTDLGARGTGTKQVWIAVPARPAALLCHRRCRTFVFCTWPQKSSALLL